MASEQPAQAGSQPIRLLQRKEMDQIFVALARMVHATGDASVDYEDDDDSRTATRRSAPGQPR